MVTGNRVSVLSGRNRYGESDVCFIGLTHLPLTLAICVNEPVSIDSDNGLVRDRRQAIIGTNAGILLTGSGTNF